MSRAEAVAPEPHEAGTSAFIFACGGEGFTNRHLFSAAAFRGDLDAVHTAANDGLTCLYYAEENGYELDEARLQEASEAYRQGRNLFNAEATRDWLARREVSLDDFGDFLERNYWRSRFDRELDGFRDDYKPDPAKIGRLVWQELAFDEAYERFSRSLAERLALAEAHKEDTGTALELDDVRRQFLDRSGLREGQESQWATAYGVGLEWFGRLLELECRYSAAVAALLTESNRAREVESRKLDFWRVKLEGVGLVSEAEAREAHSCVTQEGERLGIFSAVPGAEYILETVFLADLPEELGTRFLSARPGKVFEPMRRDGRFWIYRVSDKLEPRAEDASVCARLDPIMLNSYFDALIEQYIRWK